MVTVSSYVRQSIIFCVLIRSVEIIQFASTLKQSASPKPAVSVFIFPVLHSIHLYNVASLIGLQISPIITLFSSQNLES